MYLFYSILTHALIHAVSYQPTTKSFQPFLKPALTNCATHASLHLACRSSLCSLSRLKLLEKSWIDSKTKNSLASISTMENELKFVSYLNCLADC
jgi:hypothetical protein